MLNPPMPDPRPSRRWNPPTPHAKDSGWDYWSLTTTLPLTHLDRQHGAESVVFGPSYAAVVREAGRQDRLWVGAAATDVERARRLAYLADGAE